MSKSKPADQRTRQANYQHRLIDAGLCPRCGAEPRDFNQRTGRPYFYGPACRPIVASEKAKLMKARRAAGLAI